MNGRRTGCDVTCGAADVTGGLTADQRKTVGQDVLKELTVRERAVSHVLPETQTHTHTQCKNV